ncbi:MAG: cell division protein FtsW [Candidatus Doudnabacteria bacterium RIFCSPHIGHO2_01_FULL_50_11]|uniref:Probable peptidoglycan glycosyltransferase FtsW n=1 Tax=Candidatus Doudnabacteria bacterium RIFCSPHIGHO2_01_FULL_50_11 TaxID=1817828 RepID=A0A1F5PKR6_9BACT|nr:MAG: cell division protein FtsW [Candidatus Doudnabacteria bacterium RIFCSPHIGHO2_01_FULL_50_11]HLC44694.1 putative lipid II flippase FtsW [Patescibacteria group bacterium]
MKPRLKGIHKGLLTATLFLSALGLAIISSASTVLSYQRFGNNTYYLKRQLFAVCVGLVIMFVVSRIDYRLFKRYSPIIMMICLILLGLILVTPLGFKVGNARRWIDLGNFFFQPSEFTKLAVILYLAAWIDSRPEAMRSFFSGLLGPLVVVGAASMLIIIEPDFGSMTALLLIAVSIIFAGGAKISHLIGLLAVAAAAGWIAIQAAPYRMERVMTFLNSSSDPLGAAYQINQALLAIGSGGVWGYGFGESRQKFNFLPEPIGDSVFAVAAEELGFLRIILILMLYAVFAYCGFQVARRAPDMFGKLVAVGVTMWVVIQTSVNIGSMLNLFPLTGIPLPFLSYGGSAIIALLTSIGILLSISRYRL